MTGKQKCELMKTIRKSIAEQNGIEYYPEQCDHVGDCRGFCPQCDAEAHWLMHELKRKEAAGSPIRIDTQSISEMECLFHDPEEEEQEDDVPHLMGMPSLPDDRP